MTAKVKGTQGRSGFDRAAVAKAAREAAKDRARQKNDKGKKPTEGELFVKTGVPVTVRDEKGRESVERVQVPAKTGKKPALPDAVKQQQKDDEKARKADFVARLVRGDKPLTADNLHECSNTDLTAISKAKGYKGYSGLKKDEHVRFILAGGKKPAAEAGSTRDLKEKASELKKAGLISGPVSSASKAALEAAVAAAAKGQSYAVVKAAPKADTADDYKNRLRNADGKGYKAEYTQYAKAKFRKSVSSLVKAELKQLAEHFGV